MNRTVVLVTHDPYEAARLGHKVVVMTQSTLQEITPPNTPVIRQFDAPEGMGVRLVGPRGRRNQFERIARESSCSSGRCGWRCERVVWHEPFCVLRI